MLKITAISDTHGKHHGLQLTAGDVLIHAGDVSKRGEPAEVADFLEWFSQQPFTHKIFIAGNHDFLFERMPAEYIESLIPDTVTYLNDSGVQIGDCKIWGSPVTPWFYDWAFNRQRGADIRRHWNLIPADTDILITHGPVYGVLDLNTAGTHTGCEDLRDVVFQLKPSVHICGHIHEAYGNERHDNIEFINSSILNEEYMLSNDAVTFEF